MFGPLNGIIRITLEAARIIPAPGNRGVVTDRVHRRTSTDEPAGRAFFEGGNRGSAAFGCSGGRNSHPVGAPEEAKLIL